MAETWEGNAEKYLKAGFITQAMRRNAALIQSRIRRGIPTTEAQRIFARKIKAALKS